MIAIAAFGLAAICVIGAVVLTALNKPVPTDLWSFAFASLTGAAGITVPAIMNASGTATVGTTGTPPAAVADPVPAA